MGPEQISEEIIQKAGCLVFKQPMDPLLQTFLSLSSLARAQWSSARCTPRYENKGKDNFDPVTDLDRNIETAMRQALLESFPEDGVWGEEHGWTNPGAVRHWSLDPVDGTRALICGLSSWSVLVGLVDRGRHQAGMIDLPALNERLIAIGGGTTVNGEPTRASSCTKLREARFATTDPFMFEGDEAIRIERVRDAVQLSRYGLDALAYARIATGDIDLVIENRLKRHDLDALVAVVRGAGGWIGDWTGGEDWDSGRIVAAATRALYDDAVDCLAA